MIERTLRAKLLKLTTVFPCVAVLGPRQSGKTTLVQEAFPDYKYLSLEDPSVREFALLEPKAFLASQGDAPGLIIDEVQRAPDLLSYLQLEVDRSEQNGQYILTGSQNFLLSEQISQTLAGRVALLSLLPFTQNEIQGLTNRNETLDQALFYGGYPRVRARGVDPSDWFPNYVRTYVERDVRQIINIQDLIVFERFIKLCAGRTGQLLNAAELGRDCGVSHTTATKWVSLLCASYLIFLLPPYHRNFNKRITKSPKLYFYDTGLASFLLGIQSPEQLSAHYLRGGLFESYVISEILKRRLNRGLEPNCYFWKDKLGREIDCIVESADQVMAIEIKSGQTLNQGYFQNLSLWSELSGGPSENNYLIYGGSEKQQRSAALALGWNNLSSLSALI